MNMINTSTYSKTLITAASGGILAVLTLYGVT